MAIFNSYVKLPEGNVSFQPPKKHQKPSQRFGGSKLHYSVDVLLAIPLTFLVYGNPAVAMCASEWAERDTDRRPVSMNGHTFEPDLGMVAVEPCCFPFGNLTLIFVVARSSH